MAGLQNGTPNSPPVSTNFQQDMNVYEDEINLIDYILVIWKHKWLVLLGSVLPTFIIGLIIFFSPRNYKVTYAYDVESQSVYDVKDQRTYDFKDQDAYDFKDQDAYDFKDQGGYDDVSNWSLNENNYKILLNRFYSAENTDKIKAKLQEYNPEAINFEAWPPYIDLSNARISDVGVLQRIKQVSAQLLNMTITGRPKNSLSKISSVIRENFENVIPVYMVTDQLNTATRRLRTEMANIGKNNFDVEIALKTSKAVLDKLKKIETRFPEKSESNIALQFDISGKTEYLPVEHQIQAAESKIADLEAKIIENESKYNYYEELLVLNGKLYGELKNNISSYYTIQQFNSFLTKLVANYESKDLKGYLNSYIKKIENIISASAPVSENPEVSTVPKGTVKKSAIVFVLLLIITTFAAFLLEGIQKSKS